MALTFGMLIPALKYAFDGYEALLAALPLTPAAALVGFSIARFFHFRRLCQRRNTLPVRFGGRQVRCCCFS